MTARGAARDLGPLEPVHDAGHTATEDFAAAVLAGLAQPRKTIPCKFLYDERGSQLFEEICGLAEYYPTRTETALLQAHADEIAALAGPGACLVEFGSGASDKVRIILDALRSPATYMPIDISRAHLIAAAARLAADYPDLRVSPVCADYSRALQLPHEGNDGRRFGFFPGSTIGNFALDQARGFLRRAAVSLGPDAGFLVGVDLKKDTDILHAAYNDARGVTAAFNLNLLTRINRELGADFALDGFAHEARYNAVLGRIEMHLVSRREQGVGLRGARFEFRTGETIHTESSYQDTLKEFHALAVEAGWRATRTWTDPERLFSIHYLNAD